jgi:GNAT superfamily N-acetyltransferase
MGDEKLRCGRGEWRTFVSYAQAMISSVAERLGATVVGDPTSDFHVAVGIRQATIRGSSDLGSPPVADDLREAVGGSLLFHSVGAFATSLEEWVRYPTPRIENLMEGTGSVDDLVMRMADTTVLYMPTSPEWLCREYEETIEFVASLPPLLALGEKQIRERAEKLEAAMADLRTTSADPGAKLGRIHRDEATLHELQADIRRELADLHSPRLVHGGSDRVFLDRLWDAARLPELEAGLERQMTITATLQERLAALASGIAEDNRRRAEEHQRRAEERQRRVDERQQRLQRFIEGGLAVITLTSLTGLFGWLNGGFDLDAVSWLEVGLLTVCIVALGAILLRTWVSEAAREAAEQVAVRDLRRDFDPDVLDRLYRDVLAPTFAPEELDPAASIAASLTPGGAGLAWAALADDEVVGGLVAERHPDADTVLVGYLAVRSDQRDRGLGGELMDQFRAHCETDPAVRLAVGEVHDPRRHTDGADRAEDRLRFFARQGARVLDVPFIQPAVRPGGARVPGFLLLALYVDPSITAPDGGVPAETVARFVRSYYEVTEGTTAPFDPELAALLERIERDPTVALLPMSDYDRVG